MLEVQFKKKTYSFPDSWDELSPEQFIHLVGLLMAFSKNQLSADQVRTLFFLEVAGLNPRRFRKSEQESLFSENVYRISRQINFMFRIQYQNEKSFAAFSEETRELLTRNLPEEINSKSAEIRAARKLKKSIAIDGVFARNIIPEIKLRRAASLTGYSFDITSNLLSSDLQADQFIDASVYFDTFLKTGDEDHLNFLVATLYPIDGFSTAAVRRTADIVQRITHETKLAVFFNFQAIQLFLQEYTDYGILWWQRGSTDKKKQGQGGLGDSLYSLSKAGYGDITQLKKMSLIDMLNLMVKELRDAVQSLQTMEKTPVEIVEATKLSLDQVTHLMS